MPCGALELLGLGVQKSHSQTAQRASLRIDVPLGYRERGGHAFLHLAPFSEIEQRKCFNRVVDGKQIDISDHAGQIFALFRRVATRRVI